VTYTASHFQEYLMSTLICKPNCRPQVLRSTFVIELMELAMRLRHHFSVGGLLLLLFFASFIENAWAQAPEEIPAFQAKFQSLSQEFSASQRRILSSRQTFAAQEGAQAQLDFVGDFLSSTDREFDVLGAFFLLASLITDQRSFALSRKIVKAQQEYMLARMAIAVAYIDKTAHRAGDHRARQSETPVSQSP
jgi:hypothetical protein